MISAKVRGWPAVRAFLLLLASASALACVTATAPRDYHCLYPGDTVGVVELHDRNGVRISCSFIVQKELECRPEINSRVLFHAKDCA